jgi:N-ethylmaleimide reductase
MSDNTTSLFSATKIGDVSLPNRFIMAPLTRCRAIDHQPNSLMADYYAQRASAGLLITECTMVSAQTSAFGHDPGIYSDSQIAGWKLTTQAVHQAGGRIFMQIWHAGRAAHPLFNDGKECVAPSAIAIDDETHTAQGKKAYTVPLALTKEQIASLVDDFRQAAINAKAAGFDGIEIHGANGYLIDQFLRDSSNQRSDEYGGSFENRARFLSEILTAVCEVMGSGRVGLRLSPLNSFNSMKDSNPIEWMRYMAKHLNQFKLAYLHVMRADFFGIQEGDVISVARENYNGHLMVNMGYSAQEAEQVVSSNQADTVAFGTAFLANPDYPQRVKAASALNTPDQTTFYTADAKGYTDYPVMSAS